MYVNKLRFPAALKMKIPKIFYIDLVYKKLFIPLEKFPIKNTLKSSSDCFEIFFWKHL